MRAPFAVPFSLLIFAIAGCGKVNPCPRGTVRMGERCASDVDADMEIETEIGSSGRSQVDASASSGDAAEGTAGPVVPTDEDGPSGGSMDASIEPDAGPPPAADATMDLDADLAPDGMLGGFYEAGPGPDRDAGSDGAARDAELPVEAAAPLCSAEDLGAWRTFMMSGRNVLATSDCYYADPLCAVSACALDVCLRSSAGVSGCASCIAAEMACMALNCQAECGTMQVDDACRKCACERGCMTVAGSCGASDVPVCADCLGPKCTDLVVNPGLIMNLVNYELIVSPF